MKKRILAAIMLLMLAVSLTGCMKMEVDLNIKANGKMDAKILSAFNESMTSMAETDDIGYSEEDLEKFRKNGWKVEEYNQDGYAGYVLTQSNVSTKALRDALSNSDSESPTVEILTKNGSTYILDLPLGGMMPEASEDDPMDVVGMLKSFGASVKFRITLPSKPISHNATKVSEDGKTLEWDLLEMKAGETVHVEFKAGGGFLKYALIMSAVVIAALAVVLLVSKKKKGDATQTVPVNYQPNVPADTPAPNEASSDQTDLPGAPLQ